MDLGSSWLEHIWHTHRIAVIEELLKTICSILALLNFVLKLLNEFEELVYLRLLFFVARGSRETSYLRLATAGVLASTCTLGSCQELLLQWRIIHRLWVVRLVPAMRVVVTTPRTTNSIFHPCSQRVLLHRVSHGQKISLIRWHVESHHHILVFCREILSDVLGRRLVLLYVYFRTLGHLVVIGRLLCRSERWLTDLGHDTGIANSCVIIGTSALYRRKVIRASLQVWFTTRTAWRIIHLDLGVVLVGSMLHPIVVGRQEFFGSIVTW